MVRGIFALCMITILLFIQQIKFENFTVNQERFNNFGLDIRKNKDGIRCISTRDRLNSYNIYNFKITSFNPNYVWQVPKFLEITTEIIHIVFLKNNNPNIYSKLEKRNENWILSYDINKLEYFDLSSINYPFFIIQNGYRIFNPIFFTLHISKAFYETILFYILLSSCILLIYFKNKIAGTQQKHLEEKIRARILAIENQKKTLQIINEKLGKKNKEILEQKEKLLKLHSNLKNGSFEIGKFKAFMLTEFQAPIAKIIKISSAHKKDNETQEDLLFQSNKLINLISEWNYLSYIKDIGSIKKSAIYLFPVLNNTIEKLKKEIQFNQVNLNCEIDNSVCFVTIDVLRLKLLLHYFFSDISKYSEINSTLNIEIGYKNSFLKIIVVSDSIILKNNWYNILHYSPYLKALQVLLEDLNGEFFNHLEESFKSTLQIPLEFAAKNVKIKETISWKHFGNQDQFPLNKKTLLIFSDQSNYTIANQILENSNYHLIFENSVASLNAAITQINFSALLFYHATLSKEFIHFLDINKKTSGHNMPMIYISEDINHELNEQLLDYGIDTFIQLPTSPSFIIKKIDSLIEKKKEILQENKIQQKIFKVLTDDIPLITNTDKLIKRALEIIQNEMHDTSFNVETLIRNLGISRIKCYRIFKEILDQSPSDVITTFRLQKAEILLKTKKLNISEISFECGYNDPKYFGRSFKKYFGKSPKEYKMLS